MGATSHLLPELTGAMCPLFQSLPFWWAHILLSWTPDTISMLGPVSDRQFYLNKADPGHSRSFTPALTGKGFIPLQLTGLRLKAQRYHGQSPGEAGWGGVLWQPKNCTLQGEQTGGKVRYLHLGFASRFFVWFWFLEAGSLYTALTVLEFSM